MLSACGLKKPFATRRSSGWQLERACLDCPQRIARLLVFLVVAYGWLLIWVHALESAHCSAPVKMRLDGSFISRWSLFRQGPQAFLLASPRF